MNKHTPGPWRYIGWTDKHLKFAVTNDVEHVGFGVAPICKTRTEADAALIAAAPELLEALQDAIACFEARIRGAVLNREHERIGKMRAAIAKAEGR